MKNSGERNRIATWAGMVLQYMVMSIVYDQLLEDPTLPEKVAALAARLDSERANRERFYAKISPDDKAEFINGQVIMHSPARARHLIVTQHLGALLIAFQETLGCGKVFLEKALCVFPRNDYEPDIVFFGPEKARDIAPDTLRFPVPDFICEVLSDSTVGNDRGVKYQDYAAHGVGEYWIVDPVAEILEQYLLEGDAYDLRLKSDSGEVTSRVIQGLRIPVRALFDSAVQLQTLRDLLE